MLNGEGTSADGAAEDGDDGDDGDEGDEVALDMLATLAIVLHHYAAWSAAPERAVDGHKFRVDDATAHADGGDAATRDGNWRTRNWRVPAAWAAPAEPAPAHAVLGSSEGEECADDDAEHAGLLGGLFAESVHEPP